MPLTPHPKDIAPAKIIEPGTFTSKVNEEKNANQASDTYALEAKDGKVLGVNGETKGFAKVKMNFTKKSAEDGNPAMNASDPLFLKTNFYFDEKNDSSNVLGDRGLLTRSVATYETDKLLGLNSVSEEKLGVDANKNVIGISIQADGAGVSGNKGLLAVDYSDPRIQRGLSDLEVSDFITGQIDRHNGNIFIDPATGKVTGIDNDLGFPEVSREALMEDMALNGKMVTGMPQTMHKDTAEKILEADPAQLRKLLSTKPPKGGGAPLSKDAVDGAVNRLTALQDELRKGNNSSITVVDAFDKNTFDAAIKSQINSFEKQHAKVNDKVNGNGTAYKDLQPSREARMTMDDCQKTSYLGKVVLTHKKNDLTPANEQLAKVTVAPKAARNDSLAAYNKLSPGEKKAFDENLKRLNKLEAKLDEKEKQIAKLERPSLREKLSAIGRGGTETVKQSEENKAAQLRQQIAQEKSDLKLKVNVMVYPITTVNIPKLPETPDKKPLEINGKVQSQKHGVDESTLNQNDKVLGELNNKRPTLRQTNPELERATQKQDQNKVGVKVK